MSPTVRALGPDDTAAAMRLSGESFGWTPDPANPPDWPPPGAHAFGTEVDGDLVGAVTVREYRSWFGGREVPTAGIASVAVAAEHRGGGLLTPLMTAALDDARARGAVISTLYPTAPGVYRRFGYELVGEITTVDVPVSSLGRIAPAPEITVRRAVTADAPLIRRVYDTWAAAQNGPLTRRGPSSTRDDPTASVTAVSLAVDGQGAVVGYASWNRADGYDDRTSVLRVTELIALTGAAHRALWRMFAGFSSSTATIRLSTSGEDVTRLALPAGGWTPTAHVPYGLAVLDVAGAFSARGVGPLEATLPFGVMGMGRFVLTTAGGVATCTPSPRREGPMFTPAGIALAYAGVQPCAALRFAGMLSGSDRDDAVWDAVLGGRRFHVRDYF